MTSSLEMEWAYSEIKKNKKEVNNKEKI